VLGSKTDKLFGAEGAGFALQNHTSEPQMNWQTS